MRLQIVFLQADSSDTINEAELYGPGEQEEVYSGLRTQDLQEAKDQLLVETSDMLHIPLFTAEALLRNNGQSISLSANLMKLIVVWLLTELQLLQKR
jgi:hypothetical protein